MSDDLQNYLEFGITLAQKAGAMMRENYSHEVFADWKADGTPLTETDTAINRMVIEAINERYPEHAVMGEEEDWEAESEYVWSCDPIDGTIPYSHGLQMSTFSLALVVDGEPVVGIVYDPFHDELFSAMKGGGCWVNERRVQVSDTDRLENTVVEYDGTPDWFDEDGLGRGIHGRRAMAIRPQSFIIGAKQVASGHFSGAFFAAKKPYDCAAVKILIEEAGGKTSDLDGIGQRYDQQINGFVGSNGKVHEELLEIVREVTRNAKF